MAVDEDENVRGKLISFVPERCASQCGLLEAKQRRPKKKARAVQFDDDEDLYDGGELLFGFHLPPVKTEVHFISDINETESSADQLQLVPNADIVSWHPTVEWKKSLKESCDLFNTKINTKAATEGMDYDLMLKEIQSDPTFDHYMNKFSILWKAINNLSNKQAQDDILLMDRSNIYKAEKQLEKTQRVLKVLKSLRKDRARARDNALEELKKEGFEYRYEKKEKPSKDSPKIIPTRVDNNAKASTSHLIVIEEQYESDSDKDDNQRDDMSSGGSVMDEDFGMIVTPQVELVAEMVTDAEPERSDIIAEAEVPTPLPCYNNISGAVIKRRADVDSKNISDAARPEEPADNARSMPLQTTNEPDDPMQNTSKLLSFYEALDDPQPIRNLKRKASEDLINEDAKRKLERDSSGQIISPAEKSRGFSSDDFATIVQQTHEDLSNLPNYLDDDIICIDEDSDQTLITGTHEAFDGYICSGTYAQRLRAYNLPPLEEVHANKREEILGVPSPSVYERLLPPIKRKDNGDRCSIFLDLGLKSRNIRDVAVYEKLYNGLSIEEQLACNGEKELTDIERDYAARHIIPQYGSVPYANFKFPTKDLYEGFYWPIFQPIDDIPISGDDTIFNADVQNQIVNQTICNYAAKRDLLCDGNDDGISFWNGSYMEGCDAYENPHKKKSGRFTNRVCFARNLPSKEVESRNLRAKEINRADDEKYRRDIERQREVQKQEFLAKYGKTEDEANSGTFLEREYREALWSTTLSAHVRESQRDNYSLKEDGGIRNRSRYPTNWFEVPFNEYIPANDRRTFLCIYINHYNKPIVNSSTMMPVPRNLEVTSERYVEAIVPWIAGAFTAAFAFQYDKNKKFSKISANNKSSHLLLAEGRLKSLEKNFPRGTTISLQELEALCKMEEWEWEYWPLIWDSLCSIYRKLPPLSHVMKFIQDAVDTAFKDIAKLPHRQKYFLKYTERKSSYLLA